MKSQINNQLVYSMFHDKEMGSLTTLVNHEQERNLPVFGYLQFFYSCRNFLTSFAPTKANMRIMAIHNVHVSRFRQRRRPNKTPFIVIVMVTSLCVVKCFAEGHFQNVIMTLHVETLYKKKESGMLESRFFAAISDNALLRFCSSLFLFCFYNGRRWLVLCSKGVLLNILL